jgi:hypothetical protein
MTVTYLFISAYLSALNCRAPPVTQTPRSSPGRANISYSADNFYKPSDPHLVMVRVVSVGPGE